MSFRIGYRYDDRMHCQKHVFECRLLSRITVIQSVDKEPFLTKASLISKLNQLKIEIAPKTTVPKTTWQSSI
jgi:hypothetical protein